MNKYKDDFIAVTDIETEGTGENARISSIATILLDPVSMEEVGNFYMVCELDCPLNRKRVQTKATMEFWDLCKEKFPKAHSAIYGPEVEKVGLRKALKLLTTKIHEVCGTATIQHFGNGPEFDCQILDNAYRQAGMETPWKFFNQQSIRTVRFMEHFHGRDPFKDVKLEGVKHHAFWDAKYEANILRVALGFTPVYVSDSETKMDPSWKTLFS